MDTQDEHEQLRLSLGAYVLGGLSASETVAVEGHLVRCVDCSADADTLTEAVLALTMFTGPERLAGWYGPPVE